MHHQMAHPRSAEFATGPRDGSIDMGTGIPGPPRDAAEDSVMAQLDGLSEALGYHRQLMDELRSAVSPILRPHPVANQVNCSGASQASCGCPLSTRLPDTRIAVIAMNNDLRQLVEAVGLWTVPFPFPRLPRNPDPWRRNHPSPHPRASRDRRSPRCRRV